MAPDFVDHDLQLRGLESFKKYVSTFIKGFPDMHMTIEDIIKKGDRVWIRVEGTGTHTGEFRGLAPTGKKITFKSFMIWRIVDGKIVARESQVWDFIDFFKQLGVIDYKGFPDEKTSETVDL
jgi:predicted ester cyclase